MDEKTPLKPTASLKEICEYICKFNHMPKFMSLKEYQEKYVFPNRKEASMNETLDRGMGEIMKLAREIDKSNPKECD